MKLTLSFFPCFYEPLIDVNIFFFIQRNQLFTRTKTLWQAFIADTLIIIARKVIHLLEILLITNVQFVHITALVAKIKNAAGNKAH